MAVATPIRIGGDRDLTLVPALEHLTHRERLAVDDGERALVETGGRERPGDGDQPCDQRGDEQTQDEAGTALGLHLLPDDGLGAVVRPQQRVVEEDVEEDLHDHEHHEDDQHRQEQRAGAGEELAPAVADGIRGAVRPRGRAAGSRLAVGARGRRGAVPAVAAGGPAVDVTGRRRRRQVGGRRWWRCGGRRLLRGRRRGCGLVGRSFGPRGLVRVTHGRQSRGRRARMSLVPSTASR